MKLVLANFNKKKRKIIITNEIQLADDDVIVIQLPRKRYTVDQVRSASEAFKEAFSKNQIMIAPSDLDISVIKVVKDGETYNVKDESQAKK